MITIKATQLNEKEWESLSLITNETYYKIQFAENGLGPKAEYSEQTFNIFQRLHTRS